MSQPTMPLWSPTAASTYIPMFGELAGERGAFLSDDRRYRYLLWRLWGAEPPALFIGLNPSTADESADDPTIRRCMRFARDWGHGGLLMANLYAWRATKPEALRTVDQPVGDRNDVVIRAAADAAGVRVAAWGAWPGPDPRRPERLMDHVGELRVLGLTRDGAPRHPLYMPASSTPVLWSAA